MISKIYKILKTKTAHNCLYLPKQPIKSGPGSSPAGFIERITERTVVPMADFTFPPVVYLVIPCYNEEAVLPETVRQLTLQMESLQKNGLAAPQSRMLLVDDGSRDQTWKLISDFCRENPWVCGLKLAHNRGHQNALLAGLMEARLHADCAISLDADLQDDIGVLPDFLQKYREGCDVVYGVRSSRKKDTFFKRTTAQGFYRMMKLLGVDVVYNHADYRLMSRRALDALSEYKEVNLFLRGIVPLIGYRSDYVFYERHERFAGESKYPLKKMLSFALDGITSFSVKPLKIISNLGILLSLCSVAGLLYALISHFVGYTVAGWTAIVCSIWLLGGIQLLCIGVVGGYVGKIYTEVKARPRFRIEEKQGSLLPLPSPEPQKESDTHP